MATSIPLQPEYQFYTSVEITVHINGRNLQGDYDYSFTVSKTGEHFQSLTIKEGSLDESGEQLAPDSSGANCANGEVKLYDEDTGLFLALVSSKSSGGSQLTNYLDIVLKTYTGNREYRNCRINDWSLSFSEGVPVITLKWQRLPNDSIAPPNEPDKAPFDTSIIKKRFIDEGFSTFKEFVEAFNEAFTEKYSFVYSEEGSLTKLHPLNSNGKLPDGEIKFSYNDKRAKDSGTTSSYEEIYRFAFKAQTKNLNSWSALSLIMYEFCANCTVGDEKSLYWRICDNNQILLYTVANLNNMIQPNEDTNDTLSNTVFVYNAAIKEAQLYKTGYGEMVAFPIESLNTTIQNDHIMVTNLEDQANSQNPNGNAIITSGGRIMIPQGLPQAVTSAIMRMSSLYLNQQLTVDITVYNYIHFYTCGRTLVTLVVFDHMGQVMEYFSRHPMRVYRYTYTLDSNSGVVKAQVTLKPDFTLDKQSFYNTTGLYLRDFVVNGYGNPIGVMPNPNEIVTDYSDFGANVTTTDAKDYEVSMNKLSLDTALNLYSEFVSKYAYPHQMIDKDGKPSGKAWNHHIPSSFLYRMVKANCIWLVDLIIGVAGYAIYFDEDAEASKVISKELLDEAGVRDPVLDYKKTAWTDYTSSGKRPKDPYKDGITTGVSIAHYNRSGLSSFYRAEPITAIMPNLNGDGSIIYKDDGSYLTSQYTVTYQGNVLYGWGMKTSSSTALHPSVVVTDPDTHYLTNTTNGRVCLNGKLSDSNMLMIGPDYTKEGFMPYKEAQQFVAWCKYHLEEVNQPYDLLYPAALWMAKYWAPYFSWSDGQQHNTVQKTMLLAGMANSWGKTDATSVKTLSNTTEEELVALFTANVNNAEKSHRYRRILNIRRAIVLVDFIKRV